MSFFHKAVVFTDSHFGRSADSIVPNQDNLDFMLWMIDRGRSWGAETCLFLGDYFHNRSAIGLSSLHYALEGLEMLSDAGFEKTLMLKGNHDLARRATRDISSLNFARHLPNITLVDNPITLGDCTFLPWLVEDEHHGLSGFQSRYVFAHLETIGAMMNARVACTGGSHAIEADTFKKSEHVFCFPEQITVVCADGIKPIKDVVIGDQVLTHRHRWRKVTNIGQRLEETIVISGNGHPGLEVTANHPFLSFGHGRARMKPMKKIVSSNNTGWISAADLKDHWWCSPTQINENLEIPASENELNASFCLFLGWYLAEGHTSKGRVCLSCHVSELDHVKNVLTPLVRQGLIVTVAVTGLNGRTVSIYHPKLAIWLDNHFGKFAYGKTLPGWVFSLDAQLQEELLTGYCDGDGHHISDNKWETKSVSRGLAVGIKLLAQMLGWKTTLFHRLPCKMKFPGDREHDCLEQWIVRAYNQTTRWGSTFVIDGFQCGRVRKKADGTRKLVYNLSVEEDESYIADGLVVHNCGHFHQRQTLKNVCYIGSILPFDFSDANDADRGMMLLEWGKQPIFESFPEQPLYTSISLSRLLDDVSILRSNMTVRATVDIDLRYEEVQELREMLITQFGLRKIELLNVEPLDPVEYDTSKPLHTVDQIVIDGLQNMETTLSKERLISIYNELPR